MHFHTSLLLLSNISFLCAPAYVQNITETPTHRSMKRSTDQGNTENEQRNQWHSALASKRWQSISDVYRQHLVLFRSGTAWQTEIIKLESITIHPISIILQGWWSVITAAASPAFISHRYPSRNNDDLWQITSNFLLFCAGAIPSFHCKWCRKNSAIVLMTLWW